MLHPQLALLVDFILAYEQKIRMRKKKGKISGALGQYLAKPYPINDPLKYNLTWLVVWG